MRNELETYQLIDQYLNGVLPENEREVFEEKMRSDAVFAEEVDFQKLTAIVVQGSYQYNVRERVKNDLASIDKKRNITRRGMEGLIALLFIASIFWVYFSNMKSEKLNSPKTPIKGEEIKVLPTQKGIVQEEKTPIDKPAKVKAPTKSEPDEFAKLPTPPTTPPIVPTQPILDKTNLVEVPKAKIEEKHPDVKINEKVPFDCASIQISANPKITAACENEANGFIGFEQTDLHGGKPPYTISVVKNGKEITNSQFYALATGNYTFTISDDHRCKTQFTVSLPSKKCGTNKFVFNPSAGENLQIPLKETRPYVFALRNRAGAIVYTQHFSANTYHDWDGLALPNQHQGADLYIYTIEYDNGQQESGQITILK